jgi:hypothetical protein
MQPACVRGFHQHYILHCPRRGKQRHCVVAYSLTHLMTQALQRRAACSGCQACRPHSTHPLVCIAVISITPCTAWLVTIYAGSATLSNMFRVPGLQATLTATPPLLNQPPMQSVTVDYVTPSARLRWVTDSERTAVDDASWRCVSHSCWQRWIDAAHYRKLVWCRALRESKNVTAQAEHMFVLAPGCD